MMKLSALHKSHLPASLVVDIETGESVYDYQAVRMVHGVVKLSTDSESFYYYRGFEIRQNLDVPTGYSVGAAFAGRANGPASPA